MEMLIKQAFPHWLFTFSTRFSTFERENVNYTKSIKQLTECAEKNDEKKEVLPQEKGIISPAYVKNNKVKATVFRCVCFE